MNGHILFSLSDVLYALSVVQVRQVEMVDKITAVPTSPDYVLGVASIRGQVLPVIDLRCRLGLERRPADDQSRLLVVEWKMRVVALLVDSATKFVDIAADSVVQAPVGISGDMVDRLVHLGEETVLMLDLDKILE